MKKQMIF